jgi:APA family basic amino acid/polyamine antiporter
VVGLVVTVAVAVALIASGSFQKLVALGSFFLASNYCVCCLALVVLRRREPALPRPFRAWGYPWSAAIVLVGAAAFLAGALVGDTPTAGAALALMMAGVIGWTIIRRLTPNSQLPTSNAQG